MPHGLWHGAAAHAALYGRSGRKRTHWIWYIFPQVKGLGHSGPAIYYSLSSAAELAAYVAHPVLMPRLRQITQALLELDETNPERHRSSHDCQGNRIMASTG